MKAPIRPKGTWTFITRDDLKLPANEQTRFTLLPLTLDQRMNAWDNLKWVNDDGSMTPKTFQQALHLCLMNVVDVENFKAPRAGTEDSETPDYEVIPFPKDGSETQKRVFFERMADIDILLVGNEIRTRSTIGEAEKNSSEPAPIST